MTREEIKNTPEIVDFMLDESIIADSREKLRKRLEKVCNLAIKALEQQPVIDINNVTHKIAEFFSNWDGDENAKMEISVNDMREIASAYTKKARIERQLKEKALEQQPCEDAISRQAVLDKKELVELEDGQSFYCISPEDVETLPSVTPQPKTGHWIDAKVGKLFPSNDYKCSECGNLLDFDGVNCGRGDANYCPNCGAKMVEPQESEE